MNIIHPNIPYKKDFSKRSCCLDTIINYLELK
jgi:hypothetical protein